MFSAAHMQAGCALLALQLLACPSRRSVCHHHTLGCIRSTASDHCSMPCDLCTISIDAVNAAGFRCRFNIPHINPGDLLYAEVASKTPLGLEAKQYMDSSKTVPDHLLLTLLLRRLAAPDCQAQGWALDGFPHTRKQVCFAC